MSIINYSIKIKKQKIKNKYKIKIIDIKEIFTYEKQESNILHTYVLQY